MKYILLLFPLFLLGAGCSKPVIIEPVIIDTVTVSDSIYETVSFENLYEGAIDAPIWLFAVEDDQGRVVLSAERNQSIIMAFFDPEHPDQKLEWKIVVTQKEVGGVSDHWHEFAHGYHYIVFSQPSATSAYMMKVDTNLQRVSLEHIADRYEVPEHEQPPFNGEFLTTNDMFLVPEENGVAAAFFLPTVGHKVFRMDTDLNILETVTIGGGEIVHGNGSSAIATSEGVDVLAADTIMQMVQSGVTRLSYDKDWELTQATRLIDFDHQAASMTSGTYLPDGSLVMTARVNVDAYGRGELPPPAKPGVMTDDGGNIARYVFNLAGELVSTEYLYEGTLAHRPHTLLIDDLLITTWDASGKGTTLRIDKIK